MRVLLDPHHAAPVLRRLAPEPKKGTRRAPRLLVQDPTGVTNGLDVKRLDTDERSAIHRRRIGEWRFAFTVDQDIVVLRIMHRSHGYRWLADMDKDTL